MSTDDQTIRILVVDDEPLARECIKSALGKADNAEIVAECGNGRDAVRAIERHHPDLVFLDVQMPGLSGIEVVEKVGVGAVPAIVFVTAFDVHAIRAFEMHAIDYVLKPFDDERLLDSFNRATARIRSERDADLRRRLGEFLESTGLSITEGTKPPSSAPRHLSVKEGDSYKLVQPDQIDWLASEGNHVRLHCAEKSYLIRATMTAMVDRLGPAGFVRVHRSAALNIARIAAVKPWFGGDYVAVLHDGSEHRVSRFYRDNLLRPG